MRSTENEFEVTWSYHMESVSFLLMFLKKKTFFNGLTLGRPHAQESLATMNQTPWGFVL